MEIITQLLTFFGLNQPLQNIGSLIFIIAGFLNNFFGYKLLRLSKIICGFGVGFVVGQFAGKTFSSNTSALIISVGLGVVVAALSNFIFELGVFVFGAVMTMSVFLLTAQAFNLEMRHLNVWMSVGIVASLILGSLIARFQKIHLILFTSFQGSFSMTSGLSNAFGWKDDPLHIIGFFVLLFMAGFLVQLLLCKRDD